MKLPRQDDQESKGPTPQKATKKKTSRLVRYGIPIALAVLGVVILGFLIIRVANVTFGRDNTIDKPITDVLNMADHHTLRSVVINGNDIVATGTNGQKYHAYKEDGEIVTDILRRDGITVSIDNGQSTQWQQSLADVVLIALVVGCVIFIMRRGVGGI
jgi:cell division protease FtsH